MRACSIAVVLLISASITGCTKAALRGKIVFQSNRDGNFQIYCMNDDGTSVQRLTTSHSYDVSPSWSPDGKSIVFASDRGGNWDIYMMNADGGDVKRLTAPPGSNSSPSWTKDGSRILFVSTRDAVNGDLYMLNALRRIRR
jgi:TolB protein